LHVVRNTFLRSDTPLGISLKPEGACANIANYRGFSKWKKAKVALAKRALIERSRKSGSTGRAERGTGSAYCRAAAYRTQLHHVVRGGRVVKPTPDFLHNALSGRSRKFLNRIKWPNPGRKRRLPDGN
jgi:hypothetical protein